MFRHMRSSRHRRSSYSAGSGGRIYFVEIVARLSAIHLEDVEDVGLPPHPPHEVVSPHEIGKIYDDLMWRYDLM